MLRPLGPCCAYVCSLGLVGRGSYAGSRLRCTYAPPVTAVLCTKLTGVFVGHS